VRSLRPDHCSQFPCRSQCHQQLLVVTGDLAGHQARTLLSPSAGQPANLLSMPATATTAASATSKLQTRAAPPNAAQNHHHMRPILDLEATIMLLLVVDLD